MKNKGSMHIMNKLIMAICVGVCDIYELCFMY